jgi:anti-sigma B factor antagonist
MDRWSVVVPYTESTHRHRDRAYSVTIEVNAASPDDAKERALKEIRALSDLSSVRWSRKIMHDRIRVSRSGERPVAAPGVEAEEREPGTWVVTPGRELDADVNRELRRRLDEAVRGGARLVVLDMTGLEYVNSTGLGVLMDAGERTEIRLAGVGAGPLKLMKMVGLDRMLRFSETVEEALRASP